MPENPLALARLSERRGQVEQAERLYQEIIRRSPKNPVPYHRLAVIYAQRGKWKEAEEQFASAMALKPDDPELLGDLGYFCYLSGRLPEAERYLRQAVDIEPNHPRYCNNLALVVGQQGRDEESLAYFSRVNSPNNALLNHAFVLTQRNEYQRAMDAYNRALTEDRSSRVAAEAMIELSKYTPTTRTFRPGSGPGVLAASATAASPGSSAALPDRPAAYRLPASGTDPPPSTLVPSTFSPLAWAAVVDDTPQPLAPAVGDSAVQPAWQLPTSYPSTGFSALQPFRPGVGPQAPQPPNHDVPLPAPGLSRLPNTPASDLAPAYPQTRAATWH